MMSPMASFFAAALLATFVGQSDAFGALAETCSHLPVREMIDAIARAECAPV